MNRNKIENNKLIDLYENNIETKIKNLINEKF